MSILLLHLLVFWPGFEWLQDGPVIRVNTEAESGHYGAVEVIGIAPDMLEQLQAVDQTPAQWRQLFAVYTGNEIPESGEMPAILGTYEVDTDVIRFIPRFPLIKDLAYSARLYPAALYAAIGATSPPAEPPVITTFIIPRSPGSETTVVSHVYPGAKDLPENLLKFYIHFSAPMQRGQVYDFIHLVDASGKKVEGAFLELEPALWDGNSQRLTLFFDPGRIKRGLLPNLDLGMALRKGERYQLVIDQKMKDAKGERMKATYQKEFLAVDADRSSPNYQAWRVTPPAAGSTALVTLDFSESLDHALLGRMLTVLNVADQPVEGRVVVTGDETRWQFTPATPWQAGDYHIRVNPLLEDLSGNMLHSLFDVDTQNEQEKPSGEEGPVILPFQVR